MIHLADKHLSPTGYMKFITTHNALHGLKSASPLELIGKGTVL